MSRSRRKRKDPGKPVDHQENPPSPVSVAVDPGDTEAPTAEASPDQPLTAVDSFAVQFAQQQLFSGPLPHPEFFQAYEQTLPGAADRILAMAENQQKHRHSQQSTRLVLDGVLETRGQWMGFLLAVISIIGGLTLILFDKPVEGLVTLIGSLASIVGLFLWSRWRESNRLSSGSASAPSQQTRLPVPPE